MRLSEDGARTQFLANDNDSLVQPLKNRHLKNNEQIVFGVLKVQPLKTTISYPPA